MKGNWSPQSNMRNGSVNWSYQPIMHNLKVATVIELQAWLEFLRVVYDQESFARFAVIATGWNHQCSAVQLFVLIW